MRDAPPADASALREGGVLQVGGVDADATGNVVRDVLQPLPLFISEGLFPQALPRPRLQPDHSWNSRTANPRPGWTFRAAMSCTAHPAAGQFGPGLLFGWRQCHIHANPYRRALAAVRRIAPARRGRTARHGSTGTTGPWKRRRPTCRTDPAF